MSPATIDLVGMNMVGKSEDEMQEHIWACHDEIRLLRRDIEKSEDDAALAADYQALQVRCTAAEHEVEVMRRAVT